MSSPQISTSNHNWLANISVAKRIFFLIFISIACLLAISLVGLFALKTNLSMFDETHKRLNAINESDMALHILEREYMLVMYQVNLGMITWDNAEFRLNNAKNQLKNKIIPAYTEIVQNSTDTQNKRNNTTLTALKDITNAIDSGLNLVKKQDANALELYLINGLTPETIASVTTITQSSETNLKETESYVTTALEKAQNFMIIAGITVFVGLLFLLTFGYAIYRSFAKSINQLLKTIRQLKSGDFKARVRLAGRDELAEVGYNFDRMLDERLAIQIRIDHDHQQLNESVFGLLNAVSDLSERNLTVRAKVTEDATGPLADAINQLAEDTSTVLKQVREIAQSVESSSNEVNRYALSVNELAQLEQEEAQETTQAITQVLQRLDAIASSAQQANQVATLTADITTQAQSTVMNTMENVNHIRDSVRETSKRLKRLGERSQEISNIVSIINNLSERTTVLALNASMQASAAGEAGRGFSIIADEIQRLAETSRDSTEQISTLVNNIQHESNATITTMNQAIEQVTDGAAMAEKAHQQMQDTLKNTTQLVEFVSNIAQSSADQTSISRTIQTRTQRILAATQTTGRELGSLTELTKNMKKYSQRLVTSVNVFKLES